MSESKKLRVLYVGKFESAARARSAASRESVGVHLDLNDSLAQLRSVPPKSDLAAAMTKRGWPPERLPHFEESPDYANAADDAIKATLGKADYDIVWIGADGATQHQPSGLSYHLLLLLAAIDRRIPAVVLGFGSDAERTEASALVYGLLSAGCTRVYFEHPKSDVPDIDWFIRRIRDDTKTSS